MCTCVLSAGVLVSHQVLRGGEVGVSYSLNGEKTWKNVILAVYPVQVQERKGVCANFMSENDRRSK